MDPKMAREAILNRLGMKALGKTVNIKITVFEVF